MSFKGILKILIIFCCIFSLKLLCCKFGIAEHNALFGVKFVSLKLGLCEKYDKLQVWSKKKLFVQTSPTATLGGILFVFLTPKSEEKNNGKSLKTNVHLATTILRSNSGLGILQGEFQT